eukprot:scaffold93312_cov105-Phaeocystis_antarctica.AAC.2
MRSTGAGSSSRSSRSEPRTPLCAKLRASPVTQMPTDDLECELSLSERREGAAMPERIAD